MADDHGELDATAEEENADDMTLELSICEDITGDDTKISELLSAADDDMMDVIGSTSLDKTMTELEDFRTVGLTDALGEGSIK